MAAGIKGVQTIQQGIIDPVPGADCPNDLATEAAFEAVYAPEAIGAVEEGFLKNRFGLDRKSVV